MSLKIVIRLGAAILIAAGLLGAFISRTPLAGTTWGSFLLTVGMCLAAIGMIYSFTTKGAERLVFCTLLVIIGSFLEVIALVVMLVTVLQQ